MSHTTWILVADTCQAKIYRTIKARLFMKKSDGKDLSLINEYFHPEGALRDQDLVSDRQGKFGNGKFVGHTDPKTHENERFAIHIAKILLHEQSANHFNDLILIAPPAFMGLLHKHLTTEVKKMVSMEIEKDYTHSKPIELVTHLLEHL